MSYPTERAAICPTCGAKPGNPCFGNGPMPPNSHGARTYRAYREEIDRLRLQIDGLLGISAPVAASNEQ